ncbi:MAG: CAP domain-containing protein [Gaiellaceae bacterium MAG52_C11]|nr:CAP domain-containing protein [Candidatus Gaiellasilicea maunaloa]
MVSDRRGADPPGVERGFLGGLAVLAGIFALAIDVTGAEATGRSARTIDSANALEGQVLVELNAIRREHGLVPLRPATSLDAAADLHSRAMARHGFFAHASRDGSGFEKRVERFYDSKGYGSWSVGENILWASPTINASEALQRWLKSPGHRQNILTPRWREIGLSVVIVEQAPGVYGNRDVTIITTDFGARS